MDRDKKLASLATRINTLHAECGRLATKALEKAIEIGNALIEAKVLNEGGFGKWVQKNCEFTHRHANQYMRVARRGKELLEESRKSGKAITLRDAIRTAISYDNDGYESEPRPVHYKRKLLSARRMQRRSAHAMQDRFAILLEVFNDPQFQSDCRDESEAVSILNGHLEDSSLPFLDMKQVLEHGDEKLVESGRFRFAREKCRTPTRRSLLHTEASPLREQVPLIDSEFRPTLAPQIAKRADTPSYESQCEQLVASIKAEIARYQNLLDHAKQRLAAAEKNLERVRSRKAERATAKANLTSSKTNT